MTRLHEASCPVKRRAGLRRAFIRFDSRYDRPATRRRACFDRGSWIVLTIDQSKAERRRPSGLAGRGIKHGVEACSSGGFTMRPPSNPSGRLEGRRARALNALNASVVEEVRPRPPSRKSGFGFPAVL